MIIKEAQWDAAALFGRSGTGLLEVSDSGSEVGAATRAWLRSNAVNVRSSRSLTSTDSPYIGTCRPGFSVVVLGVGGSSPLAHPT
jgi:hypothetical protein